MTGDGTGEPSNVLQQIIQVLSETVVSAHGMEQERDLLDECKRAVGRGECQPRNGILERLLELAVFRGNGSLVDEALGFGATIYTDDDSSTGGSLLFRAAIDGKEDIVHSLLEAAVVKDKADDSVDALKMACQNKEVGIVNALLAGTGSSLTWRGGDRKWRDKSVFEVAAEAGQLEVLKILLQYRLPAATSGDGDAFTREINNALHTAAHGRNRSTFELIDFLVEEAGANINVRDDDGRSPLHHAALCDSSEATVALLRHGAQLELEDNTGKVPLYLAAENGKLLPFDALADAGANINHRNRNDRSVAEVAAIMGHVHIISALMERKFDVRAVDPNGYSLLHFATLVNQKEMIIFLLAAGVDVNGKTVYEESTPLHVAVSNEADPETIAALLSHGADTEVLDGTGKSMLQLASIYGFVSAIAALVSAGADINKRTPALDMMALDYAAIRGQVGVLETLVRHGADVRSSCPCGYTPLHYAAISNSVGAIDFLVGLGADVDAKENISGYTPLHEASSRGLCEAIAALLQHGAVMDNVDKKGATPLVLAIRYCKLSSVDVLVDAGADVNRRNEIDDLTPLDVAISCGKLDMIKVLLRHGARVDAVNSSGITALHYAAGLGEPGLIHALVKAGADVSSKGPLGRTPIYLASIWGSAATIFALTQDEADKEARATSDMTPLQLSTSNVHMSTIDTLSDTNLKSTTTLNSAIDFAGSTDALESVVRHKAFVSASNVKGQTALHLATERNQVECIEFLVNAGAEVNAMADFGVTPLHIASLCGSAEALSALLKHGGHKDCVTSHGRTPLQLAAKTGKISSVEVLAKAGADIGLRTLNGVSALDLAAREGHSDVVKVLIHHGADVNAMDADGFSPLYESTVHGRLDTIRELLASGADVNGSMAEWTPLNAACEENVPGAVAILAKYGADMSNTSHDGLTPLQHAVCEGFSAVVSALLSAGADPNQEDGESWVVRHAVWGRNEDILAALLLHGADVNRGDSDGLTALHVAITLQDIGTIDALLDAGADVNAGGDEVPRPIHVACECDDIDILVTLLERSAEINVEDDEKKTPLHIAAMSCVINEFSVDRLDLLLRAGAVETARDSEGRTPAELVRSSFADNMVYHAAVDRITRVLDRAPADRAWRRRGIVLMCRSFFVDKKLEELEAVWTLVKMAKTEVGEKAGDVSNDGDFGCLMSKLFALKEEGLYRTVVRFL